MKIITTINASEYYAWYAKALMDDAVWPFMSNEPRYDAQKIEDDDWQRRIILNDAGTGCCALRFNRNGDKSVFISLHVLSGPTQAVVAATLLREAINLGSRYDLDWIDSCCHESNDASRHIHEKFFGEPWGIEPSGSWNGLIHKYEKRFCFRAPAKAVELRLSNSIEAEAA